MRTPAILTLAAMTLIGSGFSAEIRVPGDHATIQAAIEAAAEGDSIIVTSGRYVDPIRVPKGVTLKSAGDAAEGKAGLARAEATVIDASGRIPAVILEEGACIDGFTITGAGKFDQAEFDRHHAERGENLPDARGAVGVGNASAAVLIDGVSATVAHCIVHDNGVAGIGVQGMGNRSEVRENRVFRNMGGGIGIADGARAYVTGNRCWENLRAGIGCRNASPFIERNVCHDNVRAGIGIREGAMPRVLLNECHGNQRAGIGVRMPGTAPLIQGNQCNENGMAGIGSRDGASPYIMGNHCLNNRLAGIGAMSNARVFLLANKVEGNEKAGIGLAACESGEAFLHSNQIHPKTLVGMGIQSGWRVTAMNNSIRRKEGMPPLVMVFKGARADFIENDFTSNRAIAAIRCQGQAFVGHNQFQGPERRRGGGPPSHAFWALSGTMLSMTDDNAVRGWLAPQNLAVRVKNREELEVALAAAKRGTTILVEPGEYRGGISADALTGAEGKPIVITGAQRENKPVIKGGNAGMHLRSPRFVELRDLVFDGARVNGLNIDDGGNPDAPARDLLLSGLEIRNARPEGNRDGIKLSGVRDFRIDDCDIEHWGAGGSGIDMVGCHDGVVFRCDFTHANDAVGANGVQTKGGSSGVAIRRCRFENVGGRGVNLGGGTGADFFRPRNATCEAKDIVVEDCLFRGGMAPVAFVGIDGGIVRNNTIIHPARWVARILQENTDEGLVPCRNGRFERNFVQFRSGELRTAVNVGAHTQPETFEFSENVWFCTDTIEASRRLITLPVEERGGMYASEMKAWELRKGRMGQWLVHGVGLRGGTW